MSFSLDPQSPIPSEDISSQLLPGPLSWCLVPLPSCLVPSFMSVSIIVECSLQTCLQLGRGHQGGSALQGLRQTLASCILPGYGGLGLSIEGPSKVDINCEDMEDGTCKVTYCPTEPGTYIINIKFADKHVPGEMWGSTGLGWAGRSRQGQSGQAA